ncbi:hypothetical protein [Moorena sp. SIO3I6]|uniref:hypothetical protein n=1 Tax=Moorena sp. SIO3I6 TaxID=2607831 RepID=UPI0013F91815|nr:hypothetical protein [Moorena sp. SIO3I6]NEP28025.1 hypothetical protein [Moorena sp. SIO3I6]
MNKKKKRQQRQSRLQRQAKKKQQKRQLLDELGMPGDPFQVIYQDGVPVLLCFSED